MASSNLPYAVVGATGQQGGAVVDALLAAGAPVRALVRDPDSDRSTALAGRGVELARADLDDGDSLSAALADVTALFLMTTFTGPRGTDGEVEQGTTVVDAAARAGVPRVVYSSVGGAERHTGIPHFESKRRVEQHLEGALPCTFVRPAFFMENLASTDTEADEIVLNLPMPGDVPLQVVAVRDIGVVCAAALLDPTSIEGSVEIAGDELTGDQMAERFAQAYSKPARYQAVPVDSLDDPDLQAMFRWFVDTPAYAADRAATLRLDPDVLDLAGWLAQRR